MFDIDRILAIPDESVDYLQMGISGGERAALAARGFVRKDGTKAKDYMIRTIQKTEKNKAKAEKAIIKGDKPLSNTNGTFLSSNPRNAERQDSMRKDMEVLKNTQFKYDQGQKATVVTGSGDRTRKEEVGILDSYVQDGQVRYTVYPKGKKSSVGSHFWVKESDLTPVASTKKQSKSKPENTPITPAPATKKIAVTYNKKGDLSEGSAAKKIKAAIAATSATPKSRKVVKGMSPRDRGIPPAASQFIKESSKNHTVFYNGKAVSMDYLGKKPKDEFKFAGMRIADNLSTGGVGFIKTPKGEYYQVSSANRSAKKVSKKEVLDSVRQSKPKQEPTRAQKLGMTEAEYEAFKKKVARL